MKKTASLVLIGAILISGVYVKPVQAAKKIALSKKQMTLTVGAKKTLSVKNAKKKVKWSIKSGKKYISLTAKKKYSVKVAAKKKGKAKVCAKVKGKQYVCNITVKEKKLDVKPTTTPELTPEPTSQPTLHPTQTPKESDMPVPTYEAPSTPLPSSTPVIKDPLDIEADFSDYDTHGFKGRGRAKVKVTDAPVESKPALLVTDRDGTWNGVEYDLSDKVRENTMYYFSAEVMHTNATDLALNMSLDIGNGYPWINQKTIPANTWTTLSGSYRVTDEDQIVWYVQVTNDETADFYIRNIKLYEEKEEDMSDVLKYDSLAGSAEQYGFSMGTVIDKNSVYLKKYQTVVKKHFNSLSAGNEMKAYSLCKQELSQKSPDGMPRMDYHNADIIMQFAKDNGLKVRGHCLVWDFKMTELVNWFFREGYTDDGDYVSTDVAKKRLESYIKQVVEHFDTKFPGVIYCWDVVNEAVGDEASCYAPNDPCRVRTNRWIDGKKCENVFYKLFGRDYVKLAFQYARKYCAKGTKLYYNDYSCDVEEKCTAIINLVNEINAEEKLIDGIGSQCYLWHGNDDLFTRVRTSLQRFSKECNVEVQVTELTLGNTIEDSPEHALWYYKLFELYKKLVSEDNVRLTNISIWGLTDGNEGDDFLTAGPYCGLLDRNYHAKKTLEAVSCSLKGERYP